VGWRWALATLAVFGVVVLVLLMLRFEETAAPAHTVAARLAVAQLGTHCRHPGFLAWAGLQAASYGGLVHVPRGIGVCVPERVRQMTQTPVWPGHGIGLTRLHRRHLHVCRRLLATRGAAAVQCGWRLF
jgi:hypothetical protein